MTRLRGLLVFAAALALALPALALSSADHAANHPAAHTARAHRYVRHTHRAGRRAVRRTALHRRARHASVHASERASLHTRGRVSGHAALRRAAYTHHRHHVRHAGERYAASRDGAIRDAEAAPAESTVDVAEDASTTAAPASDASADAQPDTSAVTQTGDDITDSDVAASARIHFVPPLRGSRASLLRQNRRDAAEGLTRIQNQAQLLDLEASHRLVPIPVSQYLRVNPNLPRDRRYCRPWTARFLAALARSHYARFHRPLQVNSAVRTVSFQRRLERVNGNAAPYRGDLASPHLTGAAIDIGKRDMSFSELSWMRGWLLPLQTAGKIDVEEEFEQACFHIDVYRAYDPDRETPRRRSSAALIAAGVQ